MPKVPASHGVERRRQILTAAFNCFVINGFSATSMESICREAKLSPGAVYHYFPSKEAIIEALAQLGRGQTASLFAQEQSTGLRGIVIRALTIFCRPDAASSAQLDIRLWNEALHNPQLKQIFLASERELMNFLVTAARRGSGASHTHEKAEAAALLVASLIAGLELQKAMHPDRDFLNCVDVWKSWFQESSNSPEESNGREP